MLQDFAEVRSILKDADARIARARTPADQRTAFSNIPLEVFGAIQIDRPEWLPNLMRWMPRMAPDEAQTLWTGTCGHALLTQSINFIRVAVTGYSALSPVPLQKASVLDFGCGWGRLIRLLYKYVPSDQIYGVDPMEASLKLCADAAMKGSFLKSDFIPRTLPFGDRKFDFIFAFSVFTHLSEKVTRIALETLAGRLSRDGVLTITIRNREYWPVVARLEKRSDAAETERLVAAHDAAGFAFWPHQGEKIEGEVTYGETSMTLDWLASAVPFLSIRGVELSALDAHQVIVFLTRST